ncbi:hypothetical protein Btru_026711 [Bulinus truncatus]|nr:hypothetical protein Btru_026711 [Bulinus truncatus]
MATQGLPLLARFILPLVSLQYLFRPTTCQGLCENSRWFGPHCQYRCNCKDTKCRQDGECGDTTCRLGWFGNKCQYLNLLTESTTDPSKSKLRWLLDDIDNTCNDGNTKTLAIELKRENPFTWLRLVLNDTANLSKMNISFAVSNKTTVPCMNQRIYLRNKTADVQCEQNFLFRYISITGDVVLNLCSLYVSGGRNVALMENTTQSSTYNAGGTPLDLTQSSNAVDGKTDGVILSGSCTHSKNEPAPHWNITFSHSWMVSRFVIFNRKDAHIERLKRFILQTYDNENQLIDKYQDNQPNNQDYYQVINSINTPINRVQITATAGVGRTGTFIGLFNLVEQACETGRVDFYKTLSDMRQDRMWMIQTPNQYEFLHQAVLVATACSGTFMEMNDVSARIYQLNQKAIAGKTKLEEEFKTVSEICTYLNDQIQPLNAEESDGVVYENTKNTKKNRFNDIIPQDSCRPVLSCEPTSSGDYINAVIFKSFNQEGQHILTQLPLAATLVDFWRLVTEFNVSLIVAFETDLAATDETIAEYLPSNEEQELMCPPFKIHSAYMKQTEVWEERKLTIIMNSTSHRVVHLKSKFVDLNSRQFLTFIKQSRSYELPSEKILYVCRNGALYSGLASVLSNLLDRLDHYLSCSVPLVVGTVKSLRPQVIPTLDQYSTVYDILNRYTETSCIYGNVSVNLPKKTDKK